MFMLMKKLQQLLTIQTHPLSLTVFVNNSPKKYIRMVGKKVTEKFLQGLSTEQQGKPIDEKKSHTARRNLAMKHLAVNEINAF